MRLGPSRRTVVQSLAVAGGVAGGAGCAAHATPNAMQLGPRLRDRVGSGIPIGPSDAPEHAKRLGFGAVRFTVMWDWSELAKGEYDWERYDIQFPQCAAAGVQPLCIQQFNNFLYAPTGEYVRTREGIDALARFCGAAAARYARFKPIWEIANEPNLPLFWKPGPPDPVVYTRLAKVCVQAIRDADPTARIVGGSLSGVHAEARAYLARCLDEGLGEICDAVSVHPYLEVPELALKEYAEMRGLLSRYAAFGGRDLALIQSEWAYPSHAMDSQQVYSDQTARIMLVDALAGVAGSFYYRLTDAPPDNDDEYERNYGLLTHDAREKSGAALVRSLLAELGDATEITRLDAGDPNAYVLRCITPQREKIVGWRSSGAGKARVNGMTIGVSTTPQLYR